MNLEELKLILDMVGEVKDGAIFIALLYLIGEYIIPMVIWFSVLLTVYKIGLRCLTANRVSGVAVKIREHLNLPGGPFTDSELNRVNQKVYDWILRDREERLK